ncbi:MAG: hypothetical protein GY775_17350 [Candidatus Scalindua sp.]|nr:hypothetical protein [Candidatus Scalindua sp.]
MYLAIIDENKNIKGFSRRYVDPKASELKGAIVYFELKENEVEVSLDRRNELQSLMKDNSKVNADGVVTDDYIGTKYVLDNKVIEITVLGEKPKGKLLTECTVEELERMRFDNLTQKEKQKEFESKKKSILMQSVRVKNEAEILGDLNPVKLGQDFYKTELVKLKTKYGVK